MRFGKHFGFTLAETLITLAIIGIVASLTMPSLIQSYKKQEASARLKKFYSMMSQAILLSENNNGPISDWNKPFFKDSDNNDLEPIENNTIVVNYFNSFIKPYIKYTKVDINPKDLQDENGQSPNIRVYLSDSSSFIMQNGQCIDFYFDVNGNKQPNQFGKDTFAFVLCPNQFAFYQCGSNKFWCPYGGSDYDWDNKNNSRDFLLSKCKSSSAFCGRLLQHDNWEFKSDYPYRL